MHDKLTGLLVRKEFLEQLETEVRRVVRYRRPLTVLMIDIQHDFFQKDSDVRWSLGYSLIKQLAALIVETYRDVDLLSRYDGEVFAVALPETGTEGAEIAGERLRSVVENHEFLGPSGESAGSAIGEHDVQSTFTKVKVAVNVGVATYPEHGRNIDELIETARRGMERARAEGGNKVVMGAQEDADDAGGNE